MKYPNRDIVIEVVGVHLVPRFVLVPIALFLVLVLHLWPN